MAPRMTWVLLGLFGAGITATIAARHAPDRGENDSSGPAIPPLPPNEPIQLDQDLVTILYRVGLQPENITAGGVTAAVTDERLFTARTNQDRLIRLVQSGLGSPQDVVDCQLAIAEFTEATAARKALLDSAFDAGGVAVSSEVSACVERIKENGDAWNIPLEFLVLDRSQEDWVHLRAALANERISLKYGEEPDPDDQSYLAIERAKPEVVMAKVNLDTNLAAVKTAWEAAAQED